MHCTDGVRLTALVHSLSTDIVSPFYVPDPGIHRGTLCHPCCQGSSGTKCFPFISHMGHTFMILAPSTTDFTDIYSVYFL